jgi:hypothetical protein
MSGSVVCAVALVGTPVAAQSPDPFASNFGVLPPANANPPPFEGPYKFRALSHDYPAQPPAHSWLDVKPKGRITVDNAADYMARLKGYVAASLRNMIEAPAQWDPAASGWYDMPWMGPVDAAGDYDSGRDPLIGSFTGQLILAASEPHGALKSTTENHTIVYYDPMAATMLARIWKDVRHPDVGAASFPEGSLVVKAGGVAATPDDWSVVDGAAVWRVYRPPLSEIIDHRLNGSTAPYTLQVTDLRVMQFDIIVKDTDAAPETGWVFTTFVYDKDAPRGTGPWDQLVPLGATWGNDPQFDSFPEGHPPHDPRDPGASALEQFWHNPKAPTYTEATLGWGKRMSGPIDIAKRHGIILVEQVPPGKLKADTDCDSPSIKHVDVPGEFRASGCFSCHGTSQSSAPARMYPSPVAGHLPPDGKPFCLYTPGGTEWAQWYQNRPGSQPQNPLRTQVRPAAMTEASLATLPYLRLAGTAVAPGAIAQAVNTPPRGLDYDMLLMFAIGTAQLSTQGFTLLPKRTPVH